MEDPTSIIAVVGAAIIGVCSWLASASRARRSLSADTVAVAHDDADKGLISRLQAREKYLADELDAAQERMQQLIEEKVAAADTAGRLAHTLASKLAAMESERDLWRRAARRLARKVDAATAADIMPSDNAPFDITQDASR